MCGAYGWISDTAVSAAKRAPGAAGARPREVTRAITAAIGVLKTNRRPMSSLTFAIVSCVLRTNGPPSPAPPPASAGPPPLPNPPHRPQEPPDALDPLLGPVHVLVGRPDEQDVEAHRVGAVHLRQLVRRG